MATSRPIRLILDYDSTLTVDDTMAILADLPKQPKMTWQEIVDAYMRDYQIHKEAPFQWKNYDRAEYSRWLASRKSVEQKSAQRVQDAGFFKCVTHEDVDRAIRKSLDNGSLELRSGWVDVFDWALSLPDHGQNDNASSRSISILSVNWSGTAIRSALLQSAESLENYPRRENICQYISDMEILANEIEGLYEPGGSSGRVCGVEGPDIRTSDDKLAQLRRGSCDGTTPFVIYVGDSSTDFDCLCEADLGVWLCNVPPTEYGKVFRETFKPFAGFVPPPLSSLPRLGACEKSLFYWAPNFETLLKLLAQQQASN
ncbi:Hypothetical predicted protein [Lecanosticta acicola]|uniref:Uncharacterized protein n=1 Tax=Lecanosticta acicola TaxID=111012 RepID=A0AAI8Z0C9_9PEZI|nr:Hypothetical predicted protein [Lecanosticta acicola]